MMSKKMVKVVTVLIIIAMVGTGVIGAVAFL